MCLIGVGKVPFPTDPLLITLSSSSVPCEISLSISSRISSSRSFGFPWSRRPTGKTSVVLSWEFGSFVALNDSEISAGCISSWFAVVKLGYTKGSASSSPRTLVSEVIIHIESPGSSVASNR